MTRNTLSAATLALGGAIGTGAALTEDQTQQVIQVISALLTLLVGALIRRYLPPRNRGGSNNDADEPPAPATKEDGAPDER